MAPAAPLHRTDHRVIRLHHAPQGGLEEHGKFGRQHKHPAAEIADVGQPCADAVKHLGVFVFFVAQADGAQPGDVLLQLVAPAAGDHHQGLRPRLL